MRPSLRTASRAILLAAAVLAATAGLSAQEPPTAEPGDVVTVPVEVAPPAGQEEAAASYRIEPTGEIRLFGAREGSVKPDGGQILLPVTFSLRKRLSAGAQTVARARFTWPDGSRREVDVRVRLAATYDLAASVTVPANVVVPGDVVPVRVELANRGNAVDSVRVRVETASPEWEIGGEPSPVVLEPEDSWNGTLRVRIPRGSRTGASRRVQLVATGRGGDARDHVLLHLVRREGWVGGLEHVPATAFLGATSSGQGTGQGAGLIGSIRARGTVGHETEVVLRGRLLPDAFAPTPFRRDVPTTSFFVGVERPDWEAELGNVYAQRRSLAGGRPAGRGTRAEWSTGDATFEVLAARPDVVRRAGGSGHVVMAGGSLETEAGTFGLTLSDRESSFDVDGGRVQSAGVHYEMLGRPGQSLRLAAGLMRVTSDSGRAVVGPAAEATYFYFGDDASLNLEARRVPGYAPGTRGRGNEVLFSGRHRISGPLHAVGRGSWTSAPIPGEGQAPSSRNAAAGLRFEPGGIRLGAEAHYRAYGTGLVGGGSRERTSAQLSASVPTGPVRLGADVALGSETAESVAETAFRRLRATARWSGQGVWAWLSLGEEKIPGYGSRLIAQLHGGADLDPISVEGGFNTQALGSELGTSVGLWTRLAYEVRSDLALVTGIEREPGLGGEWSVSLGIEKGLDLPLPLPDSPAQRGIVFEDLNGNGRRDPGEAGIPGVTVRAGFVQVTTGPDGEYEIRQESARGKPVNVDPASLPGRYLPSPAPPKREDGRVQIPLIHTASLSLRLYLDRDGDGSRGLSEPRVRDALVRLVREDGSERVLEPDARGRVDVDALVPGRYTVRVTRSGGFRQRAVAKTLELVVGPGEAVVREVPLQSGDREVRY